MKRKRAVDGLILAGLDVALVNTGWSVVHLAPGGRYELLGVGVLCTAKDLHGGSQTPTADNMRRCGELYGMLDLALRPFAPEILCVEAMSWTRFAASTAKMALAWGAVGAFAAVHGLAVAARSPQAIRKALGVPVRSDKAAVAAEVEKRGFGVAKALGSLPASKHEHAYDATAAILGCMDCPEVLTARRMAGV